MKDAVLRQAEASVPLLRELRAGKEVFWVNPLRTGAREALEKAPLTMSDVLDAEARLARFAPFLRECFPELAETGGVIESALTPVPGLKGRLAERGVDIPGRLLLKQDSHLAVAGSVKARGGIYEVLKHAEDLALTYGLLDGYDDDYRKLGTPEARALFSRHTVQVGSTGNLGLSIGIAGAAVGFRVIVHMSADARQWKKDRLRAHGVTVVEYAADYGRAVEEGRRLSERDPSSYFVDDENSADLFLGYSAAARRLKGQMEALALPVDEEHPLFVYLPCGVGGAPGGISFGLKQVWGDAVHCFFAEPVQAPCMLLGMATGLHGKISVRDVGLTGLTHADGLAVGRPSGFVGKVMEPFLSGIMTVRDPILYDYMRDLLDTEDIFIEPSACAALHCPGQLTGTEAGRRYLRENGLTEDRMERAAHILWATGGALVPEEIRREYRDTRLS